MVGTAFHDDDDDDDDVKFHGCQLRTDSSKFYNRKKVSLCHYHIAANIYRFLIF